MSTRTVEELWTAITTSVLPRPAVVETFHYRLKSYCERPDAVFVVRQVVGLDRRALVTAKGGLIRPSDNSPGIRRIDSTFIEMSSSHSRATQAFEIETPHGRFRLTKQQFYEAFPNVVASVSYQKRGRYHYARLPLKARAFLVESE